LPDGARSRHHILAHYEVKSIVRNGFLQAQSTSITARSRKNRRKCDVCCRGSTWTWSGIQTRRIIVQQ